ncbi:MAG: hypothetical protein ACRC2T_16040 [Thermoguttaceae bacterium]
MPEFFRNAKQMPTSLFQYEMLPTTWFYLSGLMILAIFFRFNRFWSIRNVDLVALVVLGLGLLYLAMGDTKNAYIWIFGVQFFLLMRMLFDTFMVRRPLLEPNLTSDGLTFACVALLAFMVANIIINRGETVDSTRTIRLEQILTLSAQSSTPDASKAEYKKHPGYRPFLAYANTTNNILGASPKLIPFLKAGKSGEKAAGTDKTANLQNATDEKDTKDTTVNIENPEIAAISIHTETATNQTLAQKNEATYAVIMPLMVVIASQFFIVLGLLFVGYLHFGNIKTGIAAATLYLLLPYTNQMIGRIDHFVPAALIIWAIVFYRRPVFSGLFIGAASVLVFYPIFLVPLWCGFYWKRGMVRFLGGIAFVYILFISLIACTPAEYGSFNMQLADLFGKGCFMLQYPNGAWEYCNIFYRIPILALFLVLSFGMVIWPSHKHLATLLCCSTAVLIGTQFWQSYQGGLYMAWYLPLLILTIFRPNLEDRIAQTNVVEARYFF